MVFSIDTSFRRLDTNAKILFEEIRPQDEVKQPKWGPTITFAHSEYMELERVIPLH
jgi:hypothetical protein